jgi:periplasmic protein TonB
LDIFQAAMRRAIQATATGIEPASAINAHETGVTTISFTYLNGVVSNVVVVSSSGFPLLDQAALEAVRVAHYPAPPPDFAGSPHTMTIPIICSATAPTVDGD